MILFLQLLLDILSPREVKDRGQAASIHQVFFLAQGDGVPFLILFEKG
jgi:hypothetical protein|tara:strand:- start:2674 stop:2817 length:144 start_codon:yes stop_codon:yes gene_type:complete